MSNDPSRPSQYPLPPWSSAPPPSHEYHAAPVSQYPPPPQSAPPYHYPPPTADMNGVPHPSHIPPPPHMQPPHSADPYRLPPPPPGPFQRPPVEYYGPPAPPLAPPQVVYQAAAPRQRTAIACRYCRRRKIRCSGFDSSADGRCSNCVRFNQECMFTPVSSQTQAFVPAQAAYPHLRSVNGISQAQNSIPPVGRPAGRPAYAAEGVMLYGAYGQPLNTTLRGAPPAAPAPPPAQVQVTLPPQQSASGAPLSHPAGPPLLPPQSEAPTLQPIYAHSLSVSGPTTVAAIQAAYQPQSQPEQASRKRPRPEDLHHGSQTASPQPTTSGPSPPTRTQAAPPAKARACTVSTSTLPEQVQERRDGVNGNRSSSPPSQTQIRSPESNSAQGTKSAPPASPHPSVPSPDNAHDPPSSQQPPLAQPMTTSASLPAQPPPPYATPLYPPQAAYYPPPPPHQAAQPNSHGPAPDSRPVYVYEQRSAPINGHAVPPHHVAQSLSASYPPTTAIPLHPRPTHAYQQPPPPTHHYLHGSQSQVQSQLQPQSQLHQHQQVPSPVPAGPQRSPTKPTPQPPYASPPLSKPGQTHSVTSQVAEAALQSSALSSAAGSEQAQSQTQTPQEENMQPKNVAASSGTSHTGTTVTPPQQIQIPATLQPSARANPTSATAATTGPGSSGGSSGRGLSVLDLCGPDSNAAPAAKARSTTDSDMLNALSRKV